MNAISIYRVGNWCYKKKIPLIPKITWGLNFLIFNSHIPSTATIGKKLNLHMVQLVALSMQGR